MSLLGTYKVTVDEKDRITIPSKLRAALGETIYASKPNDANCVRLFTEERWNEYVANVKAAARAKGDWVLRKAYENAAEIVPDKQGRFVIPQVFRDNAALQLDGDLKFYGMDDCAELWNTVAYGHYDETKLSAHDEEFAELRL